MPADLSAGALALLAALVFFAGFVDTLAALIYELCKVTTLKAVALLKGYQKVRTRSHPVWCQTSNLSPAINLISGTGEP